MSGGPAVVGTQRLIAGAPLAACRLQPVVDPECDDATLNALVHNAANGQPVHSFPTLAATMLAGVPRFPGHVQDTDPSTR